MLDWINQHHYTISTLTNVGMLVVWIAYLQLFLFSYQRQRRAEIVIDVSAGGGFASGCLLSNMSAEAIYVMSIVLTLRRGEDEFQCPATDVQHLEGERSSGGSEPRTRQGPLAAGDCMELATFEHMYERALESGGRERGFEPGSSPDPIELEIQVIASYASENHPVAAKRAYEIRGEDGERTLRACSTETHQIRSWRDRRGIEDLLRSQLRR